MRHWLLVMAAGVVACSASPQSTKSVDQKAIEDLDNAYAEHLKRTALPRTVATQAGFKEQLASKVESLQVLERAYLGFRDSSEPAVAAHAERRLGQLYLNTACEVATLEVTSVDDPKFVPAVQDALSDTARPIVARAREYFAAAAAVADGGEHAREAKAVVDVMAEPDLQQVCVATSAHWEAPDRPVRVVDRETAAVANVLATDCENSLTFLLEKPDPGCFKTFTQKCEAGESLACEQVGRHHYFAGALEAAHTAFTKSCELGGDCRSSIAMSTQSQKSAYSATCSEGGAIGCMQLARLLEEEGATIRACTASEVPTTKNEAQRCMSGDATACWARAGELATQRPVEVPTMNAGLLGGLGLSGKGNETPEQRRERLTQECRSEREWSCISLAAMLKEAGEDPTPTFRDACRHGRAGCHALGEHLLVDADKARTAEAVDLLTKNCVEDWSPSCRVAARRFAEGKGVPKSATCAAALSWAMCTPSKTYDCDSINTVFGHE